MPNLMPSPSNLPIALCKWQKPMAKIKKALAPPPLPTQLFWLMLVVTAVVYGLRGFGIVTNIPGGILLVLVLLTIATGILAALLSSYRRY